MGDDFSKISFNFMYVCLSVSVYHMSLKYFFLSYAFTRIESYVPGMAFLLGFTQQNERNAKQEVSASVVAVSADSVDVKIKFPEVLEET